MTIIEAFACGVPVIASRIGTMAEVVADGRTGLHFTAGDAADLARKVEWALSHSEETAEMGRAARAEFEARYTASPQHRDARVGVRTSDRGRRAHHEDKAGA